MKNILIAFAFLLHSFPGKTQDTISLTQCTYFWKTNAPLPNIKFSLVVTNPASSDPTLFSFIDSTHSCTTVTIPEDILDNGTKFSMAIDKPDQWLNGVAIMDLLKIARHIQGLDLPSPWPMIAADANRSGSVTTFDIDIMINAMLRKDSVLQAKNLYSWRFMPNDLVFADPAAPFHPVIEVNEFDLDSLRRLDGKTLSFFGLKAGDVDGDARLNNTFYDGSPTDSLLLTLPDITILPGDSIIPVFLPNGSRFLGFQLELTPKSPAIEFKGFKRVLPAFTDIYNTHILPGGSTRVVWVANSSQFPTGIMLMNNKPILNIRIQVNEAIALRDAIRLTVSDIPALAIVQPNEKVSKLVLNFSGTVAEHSPVTNTLRATPATPNPFTDKAFIQVELMEAAPVLVEVFDLAGRLRWSEEQTLSAGWQSLEIPGAAVEPGSLGFYRVRAGAGVATGKLSRQ